MGTATHNAMSYFPIGNTRPVDVTLGCQVDKECDMLLLGCGDVRNVLHTIHELQTRGTTKSKDQTINIHLNDIEDSILGRDLILLYLAGTIDPNNSEDLKFLLGVWYDVLLSQEHLQRLKQVMKRVSLVQSGNNGVYFGNMKSEVSIKRALLGMEKFEMNGKQMRDTRWEFLNSLYRTNVPKLFMDWSTGQMVRPKVDLPQTAVDWITQRVSAQCGRLDKVQRLKDRYHQEIRDYITTGVTRVNLQSLSSKRVVDSFSGNMTLLRPGWNIWTVPDDCCPYLSHDIDLELHRYDGCKVTLASLCMEMLKKWVECFQAAMEDGCILKIYMWLGEATEVCEKDLPESLRFDFIDTSNLADKIGLVSVLSCSRNRLKQQVSQLMLPDQIKYDVRTLFYQPLMKRNGRQCIERCHGATILFVEFCLSVVPQSHRFEPLSSRSPSSCVSVVQGKTCRRFPGRPTSNSKNTVRSGVTFTNSIIHVNLLNMLLFRPNGVLRTESFDYTRLKGVVSVERYLSGCIDVPVLMYPTVFGLHLAEELSLGHESVPPTQFPLRTKLTLKWKTAREQKNLTAITLDEKDAVSAALEKVKTCPGLDDQGPLGHVIKACVKSATENILQRVQNFAKATTKRNTLIEYTDHYLVTIQTDPECLKKGTVSMDCVDGDPYVMVLQNSHNGQSSFRQTLSLSCGIALNTSNVKVSRKRGKLKLVLSRMLT
ncbi:uncharacterized protein LOC124262690 isoform X2 [Haliotis rubra]|uniref:uncharacterized protein LOC124262690 isoform X2 n=1 Tax=Haliotis rubra TaxID=36100 RepID=UPI001EE5C2D5|nr:uncharacterized protein LOC124262690 isoform X2 [Haliotis rubra]